MDIETILAKRLGNDSPLVRELLKSAKEGHLCLPTKELVSLPPPFVIDGNRLYLQRNWDLETHILHKILELWKEELPPLSFDSAGLQEAQANAIRHGSQKRLTIFTGGPGTGKTYTAGRMIRLLADSRPYKVVITAPTGKAAAHLEAIIGVVPETLQIESTTLHRLLRLQPGTQRLYSERTIDADLVVVDEASMLDPALLLHLLRAIGPQTRLLLLGDPDQLPPVEGGSLFPELADLFGHRLERSMRLGEGSLYALSQSILRGETIPIEPIQIDRLSELLPVHSDPLAALEAQKQFRILCALRQGPYGADTLNRSIAAQYKGTAIPILIVQNDSKQQLYNGTSGILHQKTAYFATPQGLRTIPAGKLPQYDLAFCLSVHKSQGSEYDQVLAIFPPGSERFGKEALYTAVTRAKKSVKLWMDSATLEAALKTTARRNSGFTTRCKAALHCGFLSQA
jgi:exodeoxyribonuclease V alpha subunit